MNSTRMPGEALRGTLPFLKGLGVELFATLLFTLSFPDPVQVARAILAQGNLRFLLWLTLSKTIDLSP